MSGPSLLQNARSAFRGSVRQVAKGLLLGPDGFNRPSVQINPPNAMSASRPTKVGGDVEFDTLVSYV